MLTLQTIQAMRADLNRMNETLAQVDRLRQERDELAAFLAKWAPETSGRITEPGPIGRPSAEPNGALAYKRGFTQDPNSKTARIISNFARTLAQTDSRRAPFGDLFARLPVDLQGDGRGDKEYARTVVKRAGHRVGVLYDTSTSIVSLSHNGRSPAVSLPGLP